MTKLLSVILRAINLVDDWFHYRNFKVGIEHSIHDGVLRDHSRLKNWRLGGTLIIWASWTVVIDIFLITFGSRLTSHSTIGVSWTVQRWFQFETVLLTVVLRYYRALPLDVSMNTIKNNVARLINLLGTRFLELELSASHESSNKVPHPFLTFFLFYLLNGRVYQLSILCSISNRFIFCSYFVKKRLTFDNGNTGVFNLLIFLHSVDTVLGRLEG